LFSSCCFFNTSINTDKIKGPVEKIIKRHDIYIDLDINLADEYKTMFKEEAASFLTKVSTEEEMEISELDSFMMVIERHDVYVKADSSLSELEKRVYLRSTEIIRSILKEAEGE
jgi:hypothetical protein